MKASNLSSGLFSFPFVFLWGGTFWAKIAALDSLTRNDNARGEWLVSFSVIARSRRRRGNPVLKLVFNTTVVLAQ